MPAYNAAKTIKESIDSVVRQTYQDWELIVINDCSTDNTKGIINEYAEIDQRIKIINNEENLRVAFTRNKGIKLAKRRFIAFLDSDDYWAEEKLEKQVNFMLDNKVGFSSTDYRIIDNDGRVTNKYVKSKTKTFKQLLRGNSIGTLTVMIDTHFIQDIEFKNIGHEDYELWLRILKDNNAKVVGINEKLAYYRKGGKSLSSNKIKAAKWTWKIFRKQLNKNIFSTFSLMFSYAFYSFTKIKTDKSLPDK